MKKFTIFTPSFLIGLLTLNLTSYAQTTPPQAPIVTVWVHGTSLISNKILKNIVFSYPGLQPISAYEPHFHKQTIARALHGANAAMFPLEHFYVFGWSGALNFDARKKAAQDLYNQLKQLVENYRQKYQVIPKIRLVTHSHGGNVALNLAGCKEKDASFTIFELVLLACPVQEKTRGYSNDPFFERIYSTYSSADLIQVADPQGLYRDKHPETPLFSQHCFPAEHSILQVEVAYRNRGLLHLEFIFPNFLSCLPHLIDHVSRQGRSGHYKVILDTKAINAPIVAWGTPS